MMTTKNFQDKVVLITGSSSGIGKKTAIEMSKQGACIVLNGRNKDKLIKVEDQIKKQGGKVTSFCCDISDPINSKNLLDFTIESFGKLDILINNAGVSMRGNFSELKPEVFKTVFDINVLGAVNISIPALPYIKKSNGSVVFVSSIAGIRGLPSNSAYSSSKMALRAIAESIRIEEANSDIHVGLVLVGITEIEKDKKTIGPDGSFISLQDRTSLKVQSLIQVANSIINNIKTRRFITTLSMMGKINAFLQSFMPSLVERILIMSSNKIKARQL
jgi:short-subunit dehydrogenase